MLVHNIAICLILPFRSYQEGMPKCTFHPEYTMQTHSLTSKHSALEIKEAGPQLLYHHFAFTLVSFLVSFRFFVSWFITTPFISM